MTVYRMRVSWLVLLVFSLVFMMACGGGGSGSTTDSTTDSTADSVERPAGWTEDTHGKSAEPNYDVVFNDGVVGRIDLTITADDWEAMMTDSVLVGAYGEFGSGTGVGPGPAGGDQAAGGLPPVDGAPPNAGGGGMAGGGELDDNPAWVACTFEYDGITWNHVGVRFKGNSSLRSAWTSGNYKMPFRFDFDEFEDTFPEIDNQRFYGFKKLTLSSGHKDDSLIREKVSADIFRTLGVPAPRTAFYRLFIDVGDGNGATYFGLYTMVEVPDDPMLEAQFGNSDGNLYKPSGSTAGFGAQTIAESDFDKETNEDEADYSDVLALFAAVNSENTDTTIWMNTLESVFDVDEFLNWLAVNTVIQNWDTYGMMTHNYYLYNNDGLLAWIPWDNNEALKDSDVASRSSLPLALEDQSLENWPLISRVLEVPEYLAVYRGYVLSAVEDHFNPATMQPIYQAAHDLIYDYVVGDEGERSGYTLLQDPNDFITSLDYLNAHVERREAAVSEYLGQ